MKFIKKENEFYNPYFESENGQFAIAIETMLFQRLRIVILHSEKNEKEPMYVLKTYTSYEIKLILEKLEDIFSDLEKVNSNLEGRKWYRLYPHLPMNNKKYLEDKIEEPFTKEFQQSILDRCEKLISNEKNE